MVLDNIKNIEIYKGLGKNFETAINWILKEDVSNLEPGKYEVDGTEVFAMIQTYETLPLEQTKAEAHIEYADIHYIISGCERFGYEHIDTATPTGEAVAPGVDFVFYGQVKEYFDLHPGAFTIVWPQDIHTPKCMVDGPSEVTKVVMKVKV